MTDATIKLLEERVAAIKSTLSTSPERDSLVGEKVCHEAAIRLLRFCAFNGIDPTDKVAQLPLLEGKAFYSYRIMIDHDTGDVAQWEHLDQINGEMAEFTPGTKILYK